MALITGQNALYSLFAGGVVLGAVFMATDYVTSPMTRLGKAIFGIGCGFITMIIRLYGSMPEGVSYAVLIMNILTPLIDRGIGSFVFGADNTKWYRKCCDIYDKAAETVCKISVKLLGKCKELLKKKSV